MNCPPNMEKYENGEALSEIAVAFGEDHDVWNKAFLDGWEKMVENGFDEDEDVAGPEYSWLGYSYICNNVIFVTIFILIILRFT